MNRAQKAVNGVKFDFKLILIQNSYSYFILHIKRNQRQSKSGQVEVMQVWTCVFTARTRHRQRGLKDPQHHLPETSATLRS